MAPQLTPNRNQEYDVAIVGAGPVGLAIAIEVARLGLSTLIVDKRPPLDEDASVRPQLLVARAGDLANLAHLGVDVRDPQLVSLLAARCEGDLSSGRLVRGDVALLSGVPSRARDLWALAAQPPAALVPIGRLQQALLARAVGHGAHVHYSCDVTRLRRHAQYVSLACEGGASFRAGLAIVATGAARPLIQTLRGLDSSSSPTQRLIGGLFATGSDRGQWVRVELPVTGVSRPVRCTMLQTPDASTAGTALLVSPQLTGAPSDDQLAHCFDAAARYYELAGTPYLAAPKAFTTSVTTMSRRFIAGDGRAPVAIAGDAAQTGHVFSGQTCFINVALALSMGIALRAARTVLARRKVNAPELVHALEEYDAQSNIGAAILARMSQRHYQVHQRGAWALAGIALSRS